MLHVVPGKPVVNASVGGKVEGGASEEKMVAAAPAQAVKPAKTEASAQTSTTTPAQPAAPIVKSKSDAQSGTSYLHAARRAFEAGDIEWTLHYYNVYLDGSPNDANAWGELGNVYNSQGMLVESAQSYYNAANLLIDQGKTVRALELLPAIQAGSPELANKIYWRLTSVNQ
jgi:tetratricopeptide (TPR) repeat protein